MVKNIRINENLETYLKNVPKSVSYSEYLLKNLNNKEFWVIEVTNTLNPEKSNPKDHFFYITPNQPSTYLEENSIDSGWIGTKIDKSVTAHGKFNSKEDALKYIYEKSEIPIRCLYSEDDFKKEDNSIYTTSVYDEYWEISDWYETDKRKFTNLTDSDLGEIARADIKKMHREGKDILGDISEIIQYFKSRNRDTSIAKKNQTNRSLENLNNIQSSNLLNEDLNFNWAGKIYCLYPRSDDGKGNIEALLKIHTCTIKIRIEQNIDSHLDEGKHEHIHYVSTHIYILELMKGELDHSIYDFISFIENALRFQLICIKNKKIEEELNKLSRYSK
jgi:hypothetical protein